MTYEELKAEAKRQGYNLVPKPKPKVKALPCPLCGCKQMHSQWGLTVVYGHVLTGRSNLEKDRYFRMVECNKCGMEGPQTPGKKDQDAIKAWNEYVLKGESYYDDHPEQKPE